MGFFQLTPLFDVHLVPEGPRFVQINTGRIRTLAAAYFYIINSHFDRLFHIT